MFPTARKQPFILGVYTDAATAQPGSTGFNLDYTQVRMGRQTDTQTDNAKHMLTFLFSYLASNLSQFRRELVLHI